MRMMTYLMITALLVLAAGCATPYKVSGYSGGYTHRRLAEDAFAVSFNGNGFTSEKRVKDFCLLRCAEVALEYKFDYFTIESNSDEGGVDTWQTGSTSYTTGSISPYGTYYGTTITTPHTMSAYKPGWTYVIRCFESLPSGHYAKVFDAADVKQEIRQEYRLK
ncbi:MAG: hypothetical protein C4527_06420 [Candidatus Omnitrophota bacterium]|nr:MAG: hypothetical protein C4527_06420 [Candidatus Omnitrophota bacterium]